MALRNRKVTHNDLKLERSLRSSIVGGNHEIERRRNLALRRANKMKDVDHVGGSIETRIEIDG